MFPNCSQISGGVPTFQSEPASIPCIPVKQKTWVAPNGLTHIGALLPGVADGLNSKPQPVLQTIQGKHHYTRRKQINNLAKIPEETARDMGFMARLLTLVFTPAHRPRGPTSVQAPKWAVQACHDCGRR